MAELARLSVPKLYRRWRHGDATAGQHMAQRFSDWYYAVTAVRLGDRAGRAPLQRACERFAQGIVDVDREERLVPWAHDLLLEELEQAGGRIQGIDQGNALTGGQRPSVFLARAGRALPPDQFELLVLCYDATVPTEKVRARAERMGGWPSAVVQARYALKRYLRDRENIQFREIPDEPDPDLAPLPLYEANRLTTREERAFEQWLLTDMGLCRDVGEFAAFALSMRAAGTQALKRPEPRPAPPQPARRAPEAPPSRSPPWWIAVAGVLLLASVVIGLWFWRAG